MIGNHEPRAEDREFYTHRTTGDRGYKVIRDGQEHIKLDRVGQDIVQRYSPAHWDKEETVFRLNDQEVGRICFEADRALCRPLGLLGEARREWRALTERERNVWMHVGPTHAVRRAFWEAAQAAARSVNADPD